MSKTYKTLADVNPCRFVKPDTSIDDGCAQATANSEVIGVSGMGTHTPNVTGLDDGLHANATDYDVLVYTIGDICKVECNLTIAAGDWLKAGTGGKADPTAVDKDKVGGQAQESATVGQLVRMRVEPRELSV